MYTSCIQALEESARPNLKKKFFLDWYTCLFVPPTKWANLFEGISRNLIFLLRQNGQKIAKLDKKNGEKKDFVRAKRPKTYAKS